MWCNAESERQLCSNKVYDKLIDDITDDSRRSQARPAAFHLAIFLPQDGHGIAVQQRLEAHGRPHQRHVPELLGKPSNAVPAGQVRRRLRATGVVVAMTTGGGRPADDGDWRTPGHVGRDEVDEDVVAVIWVGHAVAKWLRQPARVQEQVVPARNSVCVSEAVSQ